MRNRDGERTINSYDFGRVLDKEFGVRWLTGEACGASMRILYDLTQEGADLVTEFFGGAAPTARNWNPGGVASVMLTPATARDLLAYALTGQWDYVIDAHGEQQHMIVCCNEANRAELLEILDKNYQSKYWVRYRTGTGPGGGRNRHEMSGRVE